MANIIESTLNYIDNKRSKIIPEYTVFGKPVYTLRNYAEMTDLDAEMLLNGGHANLAERVPTFGRSGNMLRTPRTSYAVNPSIAFDNRFKEVRTVKEDGTEEVSYIFVVDQRALLEQKSGHVYTNNIVGFEIIKGAKNKPEVSKVVYVSEDDFINNYTTVFEPSAMEDLMQLINKYRVEHGTSKVSDKLEFK